MKRNVLKDCYRTQPGQKNNNKENNKNVLDLYHFVLAVMVVAYFGEQAIELSFTNTVDV